jgi:hypothetical protein
MVGTNRGRPADDRDPVVSRAHVELVLQRVGLTAGEIARLLDDVELPDRVSRVAAKLAHYGITRERLMNRLGGSP